MRGGGGGGGRGGGKGASLNMLDSPWCCSSDLEKPLQVDGWLLGVSPAELLYALVSTFEF